MLVCTLDGRGGWMLYCVLVSCAISIIAGGFCGSSGVFVVLCE